MTREKRLALTIVGQLIIIAVMIWIISTQSWGNLKGVK